MSTTIFKAKTQEGHTIKTLAELLQHCVKTACFVVDEDSVRLRMVDSHRRILIDVNLMSTNFQIYKYTSKESKIYMGINLNHFHKMLKSIKKKDSIILFIDSANPTDLGIQVLPKENNRITTSYIKIQHIQHLDIELPDGYSRPIIVPANEYQKMCKEMNNISTTIQVTAEEYKIKFLCDAGSVYKREVTFGDMDSEESDDTTHYDEIFDTEQLCRIIKIAGLGTSLQIYPKPDLPLLLRSSIGQLGSISIYIKTKKQIEEDEFKGDEEDE
jgi:proliferating cell nuclear antigen